MNLILLVVTLLWTAPGAGTVDKPSMVEIRNMLVQAAESKKVNQQLQTKLAQYGQNDPLIKGYQGASIMIEAKHMFNPLSRWNKFKLGRSRVESAIKDDQDNFELRYLRFAIQTNIPEVLGYSAHINEDKNFLLSRLQGTKDKDLKQRVVAYMLQSKACTAEEKNKIRQWKTK